MCNEMMGKCNVANCCAVSKKFIAALIEQPLLGSIFVIDFFLVFFIKNAHWTFTVLMVGGLVAMSMYYGQKLALFKMSQAEEIEKAD